MKNKTIALNITNDILKILNKRFGYESLWIYSEIINELEISEKYFYRFRNINKLSRQIKIPAKKIRLFIDTCSMIFDNNGLALLSYNKEGFWSDSILISTQQAKTKVKRINQSRKSGRKKVSIKMSIKIKNAELVNLTQEQYNKLEYRYGHIFVRNAVNIFNQWLKSKTKNSNKFLNKNNYASFRSDSWIIIETKKMLNVLEFQPIFTPDGIINVHKVL